MKAKTRARAALRELREETGWQAQRAEEIIRYNPPTAAAISCLLLAGPRFGAGWEWMKIGTK